MTNMLNQNQISMVESRLSQSEQRVIIMDVEGTQIVVKRQENARPAWRYTLLRGCAKIFREPLVMPAHVPGGAAAQEIEVSRIRALAAVGAPVPELLHVASDWIAISYLGSSSIRDLMHQSEKPPSFYWSETFAAILDLHQRGQNSSQLFNRNAMYCDGRVVFIDFEDDPAQSLGLAHAQARDWLFFIFSSTWMLEINAQQAAQLLWSYLKQDSVAVQKAFLHTLKTMRWLRHLPKKRKPWGRDVMALHAFGQVLHELKKMRVGQ